MILKIRHELTISSGLLSLLIKLMKFLANNKLIPLNILSKNLTLKCNSLFFSFRNFCNFTKLSSPYLTINELLLKKKPNNKIDFNLMTLFALSKIFKIAEANKSHFGKISLYSFPTKEYNKQFIKHC